MTIEMNAEFAPQEILSIPAVLVNKFYVAIMGQNLRISLCEASGDVTVHRAAIVMTQKDARELAELIARLLIPASVANEHIQ